MSIVGSNPDAVVGGVDTHADVHVAAAVNHVGGVLGIESFETTRVGYRQLVGWLRGFGELVLVGVEGTGSYGCLAPPEPQGGAWPAGTGSHPRRVVQRLTCRPRPTQTPDRAQA